MLAPYVSCIVVVVFSGRNGGKLLIRYKTLFIEEKRGFGFGRKLQIWINIQISLGNDKYTSTKYFLEKYKKVNTFKVFKNCQIKLITLMPLCLYNNLGHYCMVSPCRVQAFQVHGLVNPLESGGPCSYWPLNTLYTPTFPSQFMYYPGDLLTCDFSKFQIFQVKF